MGTRSITRFIETWTDKENKTKKQTLCAIYRQYDGYPSGMGKDLAEFLVQGKLVNGIGNINESEIVFNGAGCLAAQTIKHLKEGAGNVYITTPNAPDEEYRYEIIVDFNTLSLTMKVIDIGYGDKRNKVLFKGSPANFLVWLEKNENK